MQWLTSYSEKGLPILHLGKIPEEICPLTSLYSFQEWQTLWHPLCQSVCHSWKEWQTLWQSGCHFTFHIEMSICFKVKGQHLRFKHLGHTPILLRFRMLDNVCCSDTEWYQKFHSMIVTCNSFLIPFFQLFASEQRTERSSNHPCL